MPVQKADFSLSLTLTHTQDPTNTNVVTGIGVSYPAASTNHKSSGSIINSKEGYETEVHSLYVTTTAITFVDLVLPESEDDDEDDRGSNTEMPTEMPTWTIFVFAAVLDVVIRGALADPAARR